MEPHSLIIVLLSAGQIVGSSVADYSDSAQCRNAARTMHWNGAKGVAYCVPKSQADGVAVAWGRAKQKQKTAKIAPSEPARPATSLE